MFSWGANPSGQLGLGFSSEQCVTPTEISEDNSISQRVIQIGGGATHSLILDSSGKIFMAGKFDTISKENNEVQYTFKQISNCDSIIFTQIACGWDFSVAISKYSKLYVWGSNKYTQLGLPTAKSTFLAEPTLLDGISVKFVACGLRHMAVITLDNKIRVCGSNKNSQLGLIDETGDSSKVECLTEIPDLSSIKTVACGQKHTVAINFYGEVFVWGDNKWGQLGFDPKILPKSKTPIKLSIPNLNCPTKIYCGWTHNIILTESGELWSWGRNNYGQLGRNSPVDKCWQAEKIQLRNVDLFSIGAEHNLAVASNKLYSWGWNEHGSCGNGNTENILEPIVINLNLVDKTINCIGCGTGQSFVIKK